MSEFNAAPSGHTTVAIAQPTQVTESEFRRKMDSSQETGVTQQVAAPSKGGTSLSWGRYPRAQHRSIHKASWTDELPRFLENAAPGSLLPHGLGRSYGDSCLNEGRDLVDCTRLTRFHSFDAERGVMRCESGVSLADVLSVAIPKGWFLPVTPGTRFVTVGGAIANDVHGKNHHRAGTFGHHVRKLAIYRSDYGLVTCSTEENPDLFHATIGGLGLTGIIARAEIQLRRIWSSRIDGETIPYHSLAEFQKLSNESDETFEYTVAWIDCFSGANPRGIFFRGNHDKKPNLEVRNKTGPTVPFVVPGWMLNRYSIKAFNNVYYAMKSSGKRASLTPYDSFFYPLDGVGQWNLIYGKQGFLQYQCVVPETSCGAIEELLRLIGESGMGSFLGVLKRFGDAPPAGMLSFPRAGLTLALDFAMRGEPTLRLMEALDRVVLSCGGALYPAKDARMSPAMFDVSFPNWRAFETYIDPKLSSSFWRRVTEKP
jgi:FAD/FMN-containing dehydrogenase